MSRVIQFSRSPEIPHCLKDVINNHFKVKIFTVAAKLKAFKMSTQTQLRTGDVNDIFSNQFAVSGIPETWITQDELNGATLWIFSP